MRRARAVSSGTWAGLGREARADLHASEIADSTLEAVRAVFGTAVDLSADAERCLRAIIQGSARESFMAGSSREPDLVTAYAAEKRLRLRMQRDMIDAGLPIPRLTD